MLSPVRSPDAGREDLPAVAAPAGPARRRDPVRIWNLLLVPLVVVVTAVLGWERRWLSDDGLIVLRTVRQLLAGNGPVFNIGERVEVNTSVAWTYLMAAVGLLPGVPLENALIAVGLACAAAGLGLGVDAARRLHRPGAAVLLPAGVVVLLALSPMRDFLTSGLETGLITLWLGGCWWLLVRLARGARRGPLPWAAAVVLGLGPLVRPDLGVFSVVGLLALVVVLRPGWPRLTGLAAAAAALPVGYEIFRAGYYGLLVPNTAVAKEATRARWGQGVLYLHDLVATYWLWVPVAAALVALLAWRGWTDRWATVVVVAAPLLAGLAMTVYVVRVGGDFMHGRMLLPALTALLLPMFAVPLTRATLAPVLVVGMWAGLCVGGMRASQPHEIDPVTGIVDERAFWSRYVGAEHPVEPEDFIRANSAVRTSVAAVARTEGPAVMFVQGGMAYSYWRPYPARADLNHVTINYLNLGMMASAHPLQVRVVDSVGLANPIAAHATPLFGARVGHDKDLPWAWFVADEVGDSPPPPPVFPEDVVDARAALHCPEIADLIASFRAPLTPQRFVANLVGAADRTALRYSRIPELAAQCQADGAPGTANPGAGDR